MDYIKMTQECSAAIAERSPEKKWDPGCPTIPCSIGALVFERALCDLGASVSVMPKTVFENYAYRSRSRQPCASSWRTILFATPRGSPKMCP
ncbi:unnamed protein product [Urochloa humidicola]